MAAAATANLNDNDLEGTIMSKFIGLPASEKHCLPSSAGSINATLVHTGETVLKGISGLNAKASIVYLKLFDTDAVPDPSDAAAKHTPVMVIALPASTPFALDYGYGVLFRTGLGYALVTGSGNDDETAILAADILGLNILRG